MHNQHIDHLKLIQFPDKLQHLLKKILSNGKYKDIISELAKILPLSLASEEFVKQYIETSLLVVKEAKEVLNA